MTIQYPNRIRVFDVPVDTIDIKTLIGNIHYFIQHNIKRKSIMAVNAEKIMAAQRDKSLLNCLEGASFIIPDGAGAIIASKIIHNTKLKRIPGADLMHCICKESSKYGYKIFVYGATEKANQKAVERLKELYPGINIVGRSNGYINDTKMDQLVKAINNSRAQILFVALGSPKQEKWIDRYLAQLDVNICQGVGGTIDTIAGIVKRAPNFLRKLGAEWIYRLIRQPRRIRRYIPILKFIFKIIEIWAKKSLA